MPKQCGNCGQEIQGGECPLCNRKCEWCNQWLVDCECPDDADVDEYDLEQESN